MELDLCTIDWVAVSAIATTFMVFATFLTLYQNKKQLNELKRQWQEEHNARLEFSIDMDENVFFLKVQNTGKSVANIKKIEINKEFIDEINFKEGILALCTRPLRIMPYNTNYYLLSSKDRPETKLEKMKSTPIRITATYSNGLIQKEEFTINDYDYISPSIIIESNFEKTLKKIEEHLKKIKENEIKI